MPSKQLNAFIDSMLYLISVVVALKLRSISSMYIFTKPLDYSLSQVQLIALFSSFPVYLIANYVVGIYEEHISISVIDLAFKKFVSSLVIFSWLLFVIYFFQIKLIPRSLVTTFLLIDFVFFLFHKSIRLSILKAKINNVIIVGDPATKHKIFSKIEHFRDFKINVVGILIPDTKTAAASADGNILGNYSDINTVILEKKISVVFIVAKDSLEKEKILKYISYSTYKATRIYATPCSYEILLTDPKYFRVLDIPLIRINRVNQSLFVVKRIADFTAALLLIMLFSPLLFLVFLVVKLTSRGPAVFRQNRVGKDQVLFKIYKFRTMYTDFEHRIYQAEKGIDRRITPVGKFMRKTRLDELPQLFNIVIGNMSFIGPRPLVLQEVEEGLKIDFWYKERFSILPGITGLAQVYGDYYTDQEEKMKYDLWYAFHYSPALDLHILLKTLKTVFLRQGS